MIVSAGIGAAAGVYFGSAVCGFITFFSGVLIDLDHCLDFILNHHISRYRDFFAIMLQTDLKKLYVVLHSIELTVILWLCAFMFKWGKYPVSFIIGFTQHLALDIVFNPMRPGGYFLTYRMFRGFSAEKLLREDYFKRKG